MTRIHLMMLVGVLGVGAAAFVAADERPDATETVKNDPEITNLLTERVAVLQELASDLRRAYRSGELNVDELVSAESDLLLARLDLAHGREERIELREALVESAQQLEQVAQRKFEAAEGGRAELLRARAFRLRTQVELARERGIDN